MLHDCAARLPEKKLPYQSDVMLPSLRIRIHSSCQLGTPDTSRTFCKMPYTATTCQRSNDISRNLKTYDLDAALLVDMPHSAIPTIKFLLGAGAVVREAVFYKAINRKDTAIFEAMMENGWHFDDTPSERTALQ